MVLNEMTQGGSVEAEQSESGVGDDRNSRASSGTDGPRGGLNRLSDRTSVCPELDDIMGDYSEQTGATFS